MTDRIVIHAGDVTSPAVLNDTLAAKDFRTRMPFTVSGFRSPVDYCCTADSGEYDPSEEQAGWKNGDISLAGGWFAVLFDGEEQSKAYDHMMIIAHIDEKDLHLVRGLPERAGDAGYRKVPHLPFPHPPGRARSSNRSPPATRRRPGALFRT